MRLALVLLAIPFARAALAADRPEFGRLTGLVSRDAMMLIHVDDCAACVRRASDTAIARSLGQFDSADLGKAFRDLAASASLFLPAGVIDAAPALLVRCRGEAALSLEDFAIEDGKPTADLLFTAETKGKGGIETLFPLLMRLAQGDRTARDQIAAAIPFAIGKETPRLSEHRGIPVVEATVGGVALTIAERDGILFAARSLDRVNRALDRALDPNFGSLKDSLRFREVWRDLAPQHGSLVWYANLRRMRQERAFTLVKKGRMKRFLGDRMGAFDGFLLAVRGEGDQFHLSLNLERGNAEPGEPLLLGNAPLAYSSLLAPTYAVFAARLDGAPSAGWILPAIGLSSGEEADPAVDDFLESIGGRPALDPLLGHLRGEAAFFLPQRPGAIDMQPRLGCVLEVDDPAAMGRALDDVAARAKGKPRPIRALDLGGRPAYELRLDAEMPLRPIFALSGKYLVGANSAPVLKRLIADLESPAKERLLASEDYLRAFDRLDRDPQEPSSGHWFVDLPKIAGDDSTFLSLLAEHMEGLNDPLPRFLRELVVSMQEPDLQDALRGFAARAESRPSGVHIEAVGP